MHQRDLGGVARAVKHALAEEGTAERDAVKPAHQRVAVVHLDGMAMTALEQATIDLADAFVDPGAVAVGLGLGAAVDHRVEIAVDPDRERRAAYGAREPRRQMKALEQDDAAQVRLDPV